jgi:predicted lipoprotein with Yx(FWY)xxD motif
MKLIQSIGSNRWRVSLVTALFLAAACGSGGTASSASPPSSPSSDSAMMHHAAVDVLSSRYGQVLVDGQGRAVYLFAADKTQQSTCYDACAVAWPPMLADKGTTVGAMHGATSSLTGTTTRNDGTLQVTYNGHPLYYFSGDKNPGEINCQAVVNFGAAWYVVDPNGNAITKS